MSRTKRKLSERKGASTAVAGDRFQETADVARRFCCCVKTFIKNEQHFLGLGLRKVRERARGKSALYLASSVDAVVAKIASGEAVLP